jgi:hypothetical protein
MNTTVSHQFEKHTPVSQSLIWQWQKHFYLQESHDIWPHVPHWVSSNRLQAKHYTALCCGLIKDLQLNHADAPTLNVIELGAGHGMLSSHLIECLNITKQQQQLTQTKIRHVLCDINPCHIKAWHEIMKQQQLSVQEIDFVITDLNRPQRATCHYSKESLSELLNQGPCVVIAHYAMDSLPCDFYTKDQHGIPYRLTLSTHTNANNCLHHQQPKELQQVTWHYQKERLITLPYDHDTLNAQLSAHLNDLKPNLCTLFPSAAIRLVDWVATTAQKGLLLCIQDLHQKDLERPPQAQIIGNGFYFATNLSVLQTLCRKQHQHEVFHSNQPHTCQATLTWSHPKKKLGPVTLDAIQHMLHDNTRQTFADAITFFDGHRDPDQLPVATITALEDDPLFALRMLNQLLKTPKGNRPLMQKLLENLNQHRHHLLDKGTIDVCMALSYQAINQPTQALSYFKRININDMSATDYYELGIWCFTQNDLRSEAQHLQQCLHKIQLKNKLSCAVTMMQLTWYRLCRFSIFCAIAFAAIAFLWQR